MSKPRSISGPFLGEEQTSELKRASNLTTMKKIEHRMTDYNNLPSAAFSDIKRVLKMATDRVSARLATQRKQEKPK